MTNSIIAFWLLHWGYSVLSFCILLNLQIELYWKTSSQVLQTVLGRVTLTYTRLYSLKTMALLAVNVWFENGIIATYKYTFSWKCFTLMNMVFKLYDKLNVIKNLFLMFPTCTTFIYHIKKIDCSLDEYRQNLDMWW